MQARYDTKLLPVGMRATGYRVSILSEPDMGTLGRFVISFALPALIFRAMSERDLGEIFDIGVSWAAPSQFLPDLRFRI